MTAKARKARQPAFKLPELVREEFYGRELKYHPLGEYVVIQPGVQSGLPTIKGTRITAGVLAAMVKDGEPPERVAQGFRIPVAAVEEAVKLAELFDYEQSYV